MYVNKVTYWGPLVELPAPYTEVMKKLSQKAVALVTVFSSIALISGAAIFQPWLLFIDAEVREETPTVQRSSIVLAQGALISHEHDTSGTVKILELADGSRVLRLENLDTSNGPKLEVWLSDAPVIEGQDGWFVFDDGKYRSLGALKGNKGNQNYEIPADLNLSDFSSVSIWCVTFKVSFGAAELIKQ